MELFDLKNRVALVTGGNRGIGKEIALGLSKAGAKIVVAARDKSLLEKAAEEIQYIGGDALSIKCDLKSEKSISELTHEIFKRFGRLDILVNNAGISPFVKETENVSREEWENVIRINLTAPFLLAQKVYKIMKTNEWGRIVNVASVGGLVALPRQIAYCVTKGGLIQMTKVLAIEWAEENITVNTIAPGYISTDLTKGMMNSEKISKKLLDRIPMNRFGEANEIVGAVIYLVSESAAYTTGSTLVIDGGWTSY